MSKVTLEQVMNESIWVAKYCGWRKVGTYAEVAPAKDAEDLRDFDIACLEGQPKHLQPFFKEYFDYEHKHGFTIIQDYYNEVYAKA